MSIPAKNEIRTGSVALGVVETVAETVRVSGAALQHLGAGQERELEQPVEVDRFRREEVEVDGGTVPQA